MKHLVPLYSREPVGVGTPLVESLTSFLGRLSTAQYMMPSAVCNELVRPLVPEDMKGKVFWREGLNGQNGVTWDGHSEITEVLVDALTKLTALPDLSLHTLLPWRQLLLDQKSGALRWGQRRWCASCLAGWRAKGVEPWEPLLWRVAVVRRCPVHCTPFSEVCPRCQVRQGYMPGMVRIGVCRKCGHHLETGDPLVCTGARAPLATPEERWGMGSVASRWPNACSPGRDGSARKPTRFLDLAGEVAASSRNWFEAEISALRWCG